MTILQVEQTDQGTVVKLNDRLEVARMFLTADDRERRRLHLEVKDTGKATMEMVLAVFKYARATGGLPVVNGKNSRG